MALSKPINGLKVNTRKNLVRKLILGGAQIGQPYGQFDNSELLDKKKSIAFINKALMIGINKIDIAEEYNIEFVKSLGFDNKIFINKFKTTSFINHYEDYILGFDEIFIHDTDFLKKDKKDVFLSKYHRLKNKVNIGFSVYSMKDVFLILELIKSPYAFQVPDNIFSQTFIHKNFIECKNIHNFKIYVRSVFLQGMILAQEDNVPSKLSNIKNELIRFKKFCVHNNYKPEIAALSYVFENEAYDKIIIGCNNLKQLMDLNKNVQFLENNNMNIKYKPSLSAETLDPRNW